MFIYIYIYILYSYFLNRRNYLYLPLFLSFNKAKHSSALGMVYLVLSLPEDGVGELTV